MQGPTKNQGPESSDSQGPSESLHVGFFLSGLGFIGSVGFCWSFRGLGFRV